MITWYKEVKFLYVVFINTIFFIALNFLCNLVIREPLSKYFYLLDLVIILTSKYLAYRTFHSMENHKKLIILSTLICLVVSPLVIYISNLKLFIVNLIYILFILIILNKDSDNIINHDEYKYRISKGFILIIIIGILMSVFYRELFREITVLYFFSIAISILLLRESRNYDYKIKNKNSKYLNVLIGISVMIFSIDPIYKGFYFIVRTIKGFLDKILDKILDFLMYVVFAPLSFIFEDLKAYLLSKENIQNPKLGEEVKPIINKNIKTEEFKVSFLDIPLVNSILKILLVCVILYIIYKIYKFFIENVYYSSPKESEDEFSEKIYTKKKKEFKIFKTLLTSNKDERGIVLETYQRFLKVCYKKNFFKKYMTSTVLANVLKIHIDNNKELEDLSTIYNKAKFSLHEVSEEDLEKVKESYKIVNKQLKKF
ncbi:hypothetical protein [Hathewaya massiliensis]|uniref:hypothetical protein n=1 Tax=Hathewaya massiliensis TaxID=1964382 RepID=UPI00115B4311|nr:hypothetical protein [Hathewaya massiliensis]